MTYTVQKQNLAGKFIGWLVGWLDVFYGISTGPFNLGMATCLGEGKPEFKPVKPHLKADLVLHTARTEELLSTYKEILVFHELVGRVFKFIYKQDLFKKDRHNSLKDKTFSVCYIS